MPDRQRMDSLVLEVLGLDPKKYLKPLYDGLCELVGERLLLPKMRSSKKKKRKEQDLGKLKEEIIEEILPNGAKQFPDGFVKGGPKADFKEISVPLGKLKLGAMGIMVWEICDENGQHVMEVGSEEKAKFIVYAKKWDGCVIKVPEKNIVIKKSIQDYGIYLKELKQKLYKAFMEKCGDHNLSENLTREVFDDFKLHYL
jgi:L-rhamnose mutarotase